MPSFFFSYHEHGSQCGALIHAANEDEARARFADTHEDGQVESIRRVC
jgi:hypothetical protein